MKQLILDAGSGHNPHPKAHILCDRFMGPTVHRCGESVLLDGRPFVCCDIRMLPFKSQIFSIVFCSQVLEHVADPNIALSELNRVGRHGVVSVPSQVWERFFHSCKGHQWMIAFQNGKCVPQNVKTGLGGIIRQFSSTFFQKNFRIRGRERLIRLFQRVFNRNIAYTTINW